MGENTIRSLSGAVYILLLIVGTQTPYSTLLLFGCFLIITTYEFCNLISIRKIAPILLGILGMLNLYFVPLKQSVVLFLLLFALLVALFLMFYLFKNKNFPLHFTARHAILFGYIIFPIVLITQIPNILSENVITILDVFIIIWVNDTFAYLVGKKFGKRKLFETISPKKTVEGFWGGLVFALIAGLIISFFKSNLPWYVALIFAITISFFGTCGDLIESKFKRMAGVKDSGKIMPGHGGILDRLDSIIFAAPFLVLLLEIIKFLH